MNLWTILPLHLWNWHYLFMCSFQLPKEVSQFLDTLNITKRDVYSLKVSGNITSQIMHPFSDNHRSNHRYIWITIIIKVFISTNYCSWRYSKRIQTHTHTEAPAHMRILTIQNLIYTQLKWTTETWGRGKHYCWMENMAGLLFGEKKCLEVWSEGVQRGFLSEEVEGHSM